MKSILGIYSAPALHWVGDGFPVRSLFSYQDHGRTLNPFLLLDYAGPADFSPTEAKRGVGPHPHRGFETVTLVYQGEVAHRDSTGQGGIIGPGDVQWMTAGAGILHEEFHSTAFGQQGGPLEMVQLWVNLPAEHKMTQPGYQAITAGQIPKIALADQAGQLRVIAGEFDGKPGPARTFSPLNVWDLQLNAGSQTQLPLPEGWIAGVILLKGQLSLNGSALSVAQLAILSTQGAALELTADTDALVLVLSAEPLREAIAGYGPFVMNTRQQIQQAMDDYNQGQFGQLVSEH